MARYRRAIFGVVGAVVAVSVAPATGTSGQMLEAGGGPLSAALAAESAARGGGSTTVQAAYDRARAFQEAVRKALPVSAECGAYAKAMVTLATALVEEAEGFDRPDPSARARAASRVGPGTTAAARARTSCKGGGASTAPPVVAMQPSSGEVFYSNIVAAIPTGATRVKVEVNGKQAKAFSVSGQVARIPVGGAARRYDLALTFTSSSGAVVGTATANNVWYLPASARTAIPGRTMSATAATRLSSAIRSFSGTAGAWVQNLTTGTYAGANAGAKFPAASLVKLGVLAGAVARLGQNPQKSPYFHDLQQVAGWSSNLAANRIVDSLGSGCGTSSDALANDGLRRLGARSSTYTGCYIAGTELQPGLPSAPATLSPPLDTGRYTTAQDLGRMMYALQASAVGRPGARADTGLSPKQARLILGLLLSSQQRLDNRSLFAGGLPGGTAIAQKNGWLSSARGSAGVAFVASGPAIMTLLTYSSGGVSLASAQSLGSQVASVATSLGSR